MTQLHTIPLQSTPFADLPLAPATRAALAAMGISEPTPIQARTLPLLLAGRDVIGQARTGSGKTLAFGIPLVERGRAGRGAAQALVLGPTRELVSQVGGVLAALGRGHKLRVVELVGGRGYAPQAADLRAGAEIVVGTPGRVLDHLKQGTLTLDRVTFFVLDEADEMLDRGFGPDVDRIIGYMVPRDRRTAPPARQSALFSATVPEWVQTVAARLLVDPADVRIDTGKPAGASAESIEHVLFDVPEGAKPAVLRALLNESPDAGEDAGATLVFGRTKHGVKKLAAQLAREGYAAGALQANLSQNARDRVIEQFRRGELPILVATNVAARGLDIAHLGRVINYDLPENGALFTHRVGRTGRMGRAGTAVTLLAPEDEPKWRQLQKELKAAGLTKPLPRRPWTGPLPAVPAATAAARPVAEAPRPPLSGRALARPARQRAALATPERAVRALTPAPTARTSSSAGSRGQWGVPMPASAPAPRAPRTERWPHADRVSRTAAPASSFGFRPRPAPDHLQAAARRDGYRPAATATDGAAAVPRSGRPRLRRRPSPERA